MKKNIVPAIVFIFLLLMAPAVPAQQSQAPAAETRTVEDLSPLPAETPPMASPGSKSDRYKNDASMLSTGIPSLGLNMLWVLGGIILVMALLYLTLRVIINRPNPLKSLKGRQAAFKMRGIQHLDNNKYLAAVEIEGHLLVVGVTADRVIPVADWFLDEADDQPGLGFSSDYQGPSLNINLPEDDNFTPDISIADQGRDPER